MIAAPRVIQINDHVLGFYFGRGLTGQSGYESVVGNWVNGGAWDLGIANYVVYQDDTALVFDTSTLPECGFWIRDYLESELGIKDFIVVLSHWHLDHIAGLTAFRESPVYALDSTDVYLRKNCEAIEAGTMWGPPGIPVILPTKTFPETLDVLIGNIAVQLRHYNIHSRDGLAMLIPSDRTLYSGDMLEDTVSYIVEPGDMPEHLNALASMQEVSIDRIYPSHGNPARILKGGYTKALIDAVIEYNRNMLKYVHAPDYLNMPIESMIPDALAAETVSIWSAYRTVHHDNLKRVFEYWRNRE